MCICFPRVSWDAGRCRPQTLSWHPRARPITKCLPARCADPPLAPSRPQAARTPVQGHSPRAHLVSTSLTQSSTPLAAASRSPAPTTARSNHRDAAPTSAPDSGAAALSAAAPPPLPVRCAASSAGGCWAPRRAAMRAPPAAWGGGWRCGFSGHAVCGLHHSRCAPRLNMTSFLFHFTRPTNQPFDPW